MLDLSVRRFVGMLPSSKFATVASSWANHACIVDRGRIDFSGLATELEEKSGAPADVVPAERESADRG